MPQPQIPNLQGASVLIATPHLIIESMLKAIANARAADFYGFSGVTEERNHTLLALGKLVHEFSKICNFTPVAVYAGDVLSQKINEKDYFGTIIPLVVPSVLPKHYYQPTTTKSSVSFSILQFFNFLYCDLDRDLEATNPALLLRPFDTICWIIISILSLILPFLVNWNMNQLSRSFYMVFAALFSQTISSNDNGRGKLFLLWLFGCVILNTLYSGVLTSVLIAPVEKDVMKSLDDLVLRDFHLVYSNGGYFKYIMKMAKHIEPESEVKEYASNQKKSALRILSDTLDVKNTTAEMVDALAFEKKTAIFGPWMMTNIHWHILSLKNEEKNKQLKKVERRRCHIGKVLTSAHAHPETWIFKMTDMKSSSNFSSVFNRLYSNGIHGFWMGVFVQMQATLRIQDINKFKSKTEVIEEIPIEPLGFHIGSVVVIFVVYGICILICLVAFVLEILWKSHKSFGKLNVVEDF